MPNFWEEKPSSHWAHGFLICGGTQSTGYEYHASFPRDGALPHISIYEIGKTSANQKVTRNLYLVNANGNVGLRANDRAEFQRFGASNSTMNDFLRDVYNKHLQLNRPANQPGPNAGANINPNDFPALGAPPVRNAVPPLMNTRPVAQTPALTNNAIVNSVLMMSGAFDD